MLTKLIRRMASMTCTSPKQFVVWETDELVACLHPEPWTSGSTVLTQRCPSRHYSIFQMSEREFLALLLGAREVAALLCQRLPVQRCALVSKPSPQQLTQVRVLPLHGLTPTWRPHLAEEEEDFQPHDPGYCTSKSGPRWQDTELEEVQVRIRAKLPNPGAAPNYTFLGDGSDTGLFPRIIRGEEQQWRVWEDDGHVAFLTPFPNAPGFTVLVPRRPLTSDIFRLREDDYKALLLAARHVAQLLKDGLGAWAVALIFEGFEIDYAHAKLIPLLPPPQSTIVDPGVQFCPTYPGYVTSADGPAADMDSLRELQARITQA